MTDEIIESKIMKVWVENDGICRVKFVPNAEVTLTEIKAMNKLLGGLYKGKKIPVLADIRKIKSATRECRLYASHEDSLRLTSAVALLIGSPISRVIVNFFLGLNKPPYPTRIFTSEAEALSWLKNIIEKEKF